MSTGRPFRHARAHNARTRCQQTRIRPSLGRSLLADLSYRTFDGVRLPTNADDGYVGFC